MSVQIVCTIGPASDRLPVLRRMTRAGMTVARLNFSHGTLSEHARRIRQVRKIPEKKVLVLQDLEGWRIRLGDWKGGKPVPLKKGDRFRLVPGAKTQRGDMPWDYDGPPEKIRAGMKIFVDDAFIELVARGRDGDAIKVEVLRAPVPLKTRKGVHVPDLDWSPRGIRPADFEHLEFGIAHGVDWVGLSFVRDHYDVAEVRMLLDAAGSRAKIVSKIESRQSIENLAGIIKASDIVLVARGDLGICVPLEYVPFLQKRILKECHQHGVPAITATQMLESMIENPRPTRAEVSDVANSVLDGTDYTMLSGETAVGRYPAECVEMMSRILRVAARAHRR